MLAHELRTGDELRDGDGDVVYRIMRTWTEDEGDQRVVCVRARYADGGDGTTVFHPREEVAHVRPTARERIARYVELRHRIGRNGGQLGDLIHDLDGGDRAGGCTLFLRDLEVLLAELDAARASDSV